MPFADTLRAGDGRFDVRVRVSDVVRGRFHLNAHGIQNAKKAKRATVVGREPQAAKYAAKSNGHIDRL